MVKPSVRIIVVAVCVATIAGAWLFMRSRPTASTPASVSSGDPGKAFFGAPRKYDMTNGQEMRPRW